MADVIWAQRLRRGDRASPGDRVLRPDQFDSGTRAGASDEPRLLAGGRPIDWVAGYSQRVTLHCAALPIVAASRHVTTRWRHAGGHSSGSVAPTSHPLEHTNPSDGQTSAILSASASPGGLSARLASLMGVVTLSDPRRHRGLGVLACRDHNDCPARDLRTGPRRTTPRPRSTPVHSEAHTRSPARHHVFTLRPTRLAARGEPRRMSSRDDEGTSNRGRVRAPRPRPRTAARPVFDNVSVKPVTWRRERPRPGPCEDDLRPSSKGPASTAGAMRPSSVPVLRGSAPARPSRACAQVERAPRYAPPADLAMARRSSFCAPVLVGITPHCHGVLVSPRAARRSSAPSSRRCENPICGAR